MTGPGHPDDDRLLELAYGELGGSQARELRRHVDGCPRCRAVLEGIAEVRSAVRRVPAESAPERGLESLLAYGEQAAAQARSHRRKVQLLGLLTLATAAGLAWVLLPERPGPDASVTVARADVPAPAAKGERAPQGQPERAPEARAPAQKDLQPRDAEQDRGALARRQAVPAEPVRRPAPGISLDDARRAREEDALSVATAKPRAEEEKKKSDSASDEAVAVASGALRASDAPAKVAATPPAAPAATAAAGAPAELAARVGARSESALGGASGNVVADKSLETFGKGSAAKQAAPSSSTARAGTGTVGADRAAKEARLAEVRRSAASSSGTARKLLLLEQCRLEAGLELRASAVGTCSQVAREFPGTPEAQQAAEVARGFSVQPPAR